MLLTQNIDLVEIFRMPFSHLFTIKGSELRQGAESSPPPQDGAYGSLAQQCAEVLCFKVVVFRF